MLTHSPRDRSRSPLNKQETLSSVNKTSNQIESNGNSKIKKENESQQRMRNLKSFIQTLINESVTITGLTYDEQVKVIENACLEEYRDISTDRIRRMIRNLLKDHTPTNDNNSKKNRSNSTTKTSDLVPSPTSTLSAFDADFLRHAFSQQFRPSLDLSAYFSASNGTNPPSSLFRPNFSPSSFLQSLTNPTPLPPPPPPTLVSSHTHTNGTNDSSTSKSSKQAKLSNTETNSIKVLVNAYREAASYLSRSADELEQLL